MDAVERQSCCYHFKATDRYTRDTGQTVLKTNAVPVIQMMPVPSIVTVPDGSRTKESKEGKHVGSSKTPAEFLKPKASTSSAQPPTTGQPHPEHQMTPAQARPASSASVAASRGSPQSVVSQTAAANFVAPPARKIPTPSVQPARRSEAPRSEPTAALTARRVSVPPSMLQSALWLPPDLDPARRQLKTGGSATSRDPGLRNAYAQTATPAVPASRASPCAAACDSPARPSARTSRAGSNVSLVSSGSDVRVNTVTDTPMSPTLSLKDMKTVTRPLQRKRSSDAISPSPPQDNLNGMMPVPNIRAATTGLAPKKSTTEKSKEGKYVGSSKTPAKLSKLQVPTSSAQASTTGQPHPQHQMTPAQARPASSASVAASSGSPQSVVPPSDAACFVAPPGRKKSTPSVQPARRRRKEAPRSEPTAALAAHCGPVPPSMLQSTQGVPLDLDLAPGQAMTGGPATSREPGLHSAAAYNSPAPPSVSTSRADSSVSLESSASVAASSGSRQSVVPPSDAECFVAPPGRKKSTPSVQPARRRRKEAPRSEPTAALAAHRGPVPPSMLQSTEGVPLDLTLAPRQAMTGGPAPSRETGLHSAAAYNSPAPPSVSTSRADSSVSLESSASVAASSGSRQSVVPPSDAECFVAPPGRKKSTPSVQPARRRRKEAPRSEPTAALAAHRGPVPPSMLQSTEGVPLDLTLAPRQAMTGGPAPSRETGLHSAAAYNSPAPPSVSTSRADSSVSLASTASVAASSSAPQCVVSPSDAARFSVLPRSMLVAESTTCRTYVVFAPGQPMTGGVSVSDDPGPRNAYVQTAAPPLTSSPVHYRAAAYNFPAPPFTGTSMCDDVRVNTVTGMEAMTRQQWRRMSSNKATREAKWYRGSRVPPQDYLSRMHYAGASYVAPDPQESENSRNSFYLPFLLAKTLDRVVDLYEIRAASDLINQRYLESEPSKPLKDERKPLKNEKKPNPKLESLKKKAIVQKTQVKNTDTEIKIVKMLEKREKAMKRLERSKSLNERDEKIIRLADENLKLRPTNEIA